MSSIAFERDLTRTQLLSSFVILSVDFANKKTYLDHFIPFLVQSLSTLPSDMGDLEQIFQAIRKEFGVEIPHLVLTALIKRAKQSDYVTEHGNSFVCTPKTSRIIAKFTASRNASLVEQAKLVDQICSFVNQNFEVKWTEVEAKRALETFILHLDSQTILAAINKNISDPTFHTNGSEAQDKLFISRFIISEGRNDSTVMEALENMIKGSMLATALYFPLQKELTQKFIDTTIWLDSPVALAWLGHDGDTEQGYVDSVISLAVNQGAKLGIFKHTIREMQASMRSCMEFDDGPLQSRRRTMAKHFVKMGYTNTDIQVKSRQIESSLIAQNVEVLFAPTVETDSEISFTDLLAAMKDAMPFRAENGIILDIKSLLAVHKLRSGHKSDLIEKCRHILLVDNEKLESIFNDFVPRHDGEISDLILLEKLAIMLWIKSPITDPNFPKNRLYADALAALEPSAELWRQYAKILDSLHKDGRITEDELLHYRREEVVGAALMQVSQGGAIKVTSKSVDEIRRVIASPLIAEVEAAKTKVEEDFLQQLAAERKTFTEKFVSLKSTANENEQNTKRIFGLLADLILISAGFVLWAMADHVALFTYHKWIQKQHFISSTILSTGSLAIVVFAGVVQILLGKYLPLRKRVSRWIYRRMHLKEID